MATEGSQEIRSLSELIDSAALGKRVDLTAKPVRKIAKISREGRYVDTVILSMVYSGMVADKRFQFTKDYSFAEDAPQHALECLLVANDRLKMDYDRLREGAVAVKEVFFTFQNAFAGLPGDASVKSPALRLQDFIHLARAGTPVFVEVSLKTPDIIVRHETTEKEGFSCIAAFVFTTGTEKTTIEKLYAVGSYGETKQYQAEIRALANRRLERDCERLRRVGIRVPERSF